MFANELHDYRKKLFEVSSISKLPTCTPYAGSGIFVPYKTYEQFLNDQWIFRTNQFHLALKHYQTDTTNPAIFRQWFKLYLNNIDSVDFYS